MGTKYLNATQALPLVLIADHTPCVLYAGSEARRGYKLRQLFHNSRVPRWAKRIIPVCIAIPAGQILIAISSIVNDPIAVIVHG